MELRRRFLRMFMICVKSRSDTDSIMIQMSKFLILILIGLLCFAPASAAIDTQIATIVKQELGAELRVDGLAQQGSKLWMLLVPSQAKATESLSSKLINGDLLLSNGWIYTPIISKGNSLTIKSYDFYPQEIKNNILSSIIIPEFIIPANFVLPRDLAMLAGHLPIGLADVELASDREAEFKRRLKEDEANTLKLLSYDYSSGKIKSIELKDTISITNLEKLSKQVSLVTALKKFKKDIYVADHNNAVIYKINADESFEEYFRLPKNLGIKDFNFSLDGTLFYVLTAKEPKLLIYKVDGLKPVKELDISSGAFGLTNLNASDSEADYIVFASKSSAELDLVSTFEHRISSRISVADLGLMPEVFAVAAGDIFIITQDRIKDTGAKLVAMDIVSAKLDKFIDLDFEPMAIMSYAGSIYVAGNSKFVRINPVTMLIESSLDLGTDLVDPRAIHITKTGAFALIACSGADNIGIIDLKAMQLVKKVNIGSKANHLLVL